MFRDGVPARDTSHGSTSVVYALGGIENRGNARGGWPVRLSHVPIVSAVVEYRLRRSESLLTVRLSHGLDRRCCVTSFRRSRLLHEHCINEWGREDVLPASFRSDSRNRHALPMFQGLWSVPSSVNEPFIRQNPDAHKGTGTAQSHERKGTSEVASRADRLTTTGEPATSTHPASLYGCRPVTTCCRGPAGVPQMRRL